LQYLKQGQNGIFVDLKTVYVAYRSGAMGTRAFIYFSWLGLSIPPCLGIGAFASPLFVVFTFTYGQVFTKPNLESWAKTISQGWMTAIHACI
jgi:hypothetical protein